VLHIINVAAPVAVCVAMCVAMCVVVYESDECVV